MFCTETFFKQNTRCVINSPCGFIKNYTLSEADGKAVEKIV